MTAERELFRFKRGDVSEAYVLRVIEAGAELWRLTSHGDTPETSDKLYTFTSPQEALKFVVEMKERLGKEGLL
jgi:hypothetical protein